MAPGPSPEPVAACAGDGVRRGDEGIGAVVDVEQRPLRALEQDALALAALGVEQRPHRVHIREDLRRDLAELIAEIVGGNLGLAQAPAQRIVMGEDALDLGLQARQVLEVHHPDGAPADLVLIGRADAALGGADRPAGRRLAQRVELAVQRQDERRVLGDAQIVAGDAHAERLDLGDLLGRAPRDRPPRRCRSPTACPCAPRRKAAATAYRWCRRRPAYGRHYGRPGNAPRHRRAPTANRRSCPCPRRPIGSRRPRHWPREKSFDFRPGTQKRPRSQAGPCQLIARRRARCERSMAFR